MSFSVDVKGILDTTKALDKWRAKSMDAYGGAVYMLATDIVSTALKLTPADTGYLRASRYVRRPEVVSNGAFTIECGFGAPYALAVHEVDRRYVVGEWKFLSKAIAHHAGGSGNQLAGYMGRLFAAGQGIDDVPELHPRVWTGGARPERRKLIGRGRMQHGTSEERASMRAYNKDVRRANAERRKQRVKDRARNVARIKRESIASLTAQRAGKPLPRPGRG